MGRSAGVSPDQRRTLDRLSKLEPLRGFYLAGGTAIAAHLKHRRSLDLDLFSVSRRADLEAPRRAIVGGIAGASVLETTEVTVRLLVGAGPIDLVRYLWPAGLGPRTWATIRAYFQAEAPRLLDLPLTPPKPKVAPRRRRKP